MIMMTLVFACFNALFLLGWFKSDFFPEWLNLLGFGDIVYYEEYQTEKLANPYLTYPLFLKMKRGGFMGKLFGCPLCLSVWICGFTSFATSIVAVFIPFDPIQILINCFTEFSITSILTLFIFGALSKLLNENK